MAAWPPVRSSRPALRALGSILPDASHADTFDAYRVAAAAHDARAGADRWREEDDSDLYDAAQLREHTAHLARLRERRDARALAPYLEQALHRHHGDLSSPELYEVSMLGTKRLVERFWDEVERAIDWLSHPAETGLSSALTRARFERAAHVVGRAALSLSGGASLGFFHVGVAKALFEQGLLPSVLSGASTGAMIACGLAARNDAELRALFADLRVMRSDALSLLRPAEMLRRRCAFDADHLREVLLHNNGDRTFAEAFARTRRVVNVSLSPTRPRQRPRLLCHVNAPDVTMLSAALASAAVPGVFAPVVLEQRGDDGTRAPYLPTERWMDGSLTGDVPTQRLARLHGVSLFIVSQVNFHVAPVQRLVRRRGVVPFLLGAAVSSVKLQLAHDLGLARRALAPTPFFAPLDVAHGLAHQGYGGDIDLHPPVRPLALARALSNLTRPEVNAHVLEGERSVWRQWSRLRDRTRVERALRRGLERLGET